SRTADRRRMHRPTVSTPTAWWLAWRCSRPRSRSRKPSPPPRPKRPEERRMSTKRLAFILDPLERLKPYKDSSIPMMRAAAARGHEVFAIQREALAWRDGVVVARALELRLSVEDTVWYAPGVCEEIPLTAFDAVVMRQDPPFDFEYVAATWLLERAQ